MTPEFIAEALGLAELLERENAALAALDLAGAARLLPAKTAAVASFTAARDRAKGAPLSLAVAREITERLDAAADANRKLLDRAITVQGRVLATIARAARVQTAPPQYGARGRPAVSRSPGAVSFSARA